MVIGLVSLLAPIKVMDKVSSAHLPIMLFFSLVLFPFMRKDFVITRREGSFLLGGYFLYILFMYNGF